MRAISALPVLTGAWRHCRRRSATHYLRRLRIQHATHSNVPIFRCCQLWAVRLAWSICRDSAKRSLISISPKVHALVVYNSNPAAIAPNQSKVTAGLKRDDLFTVVLEQFQTDTAEYADIVLPVTTFLEHTDLYRAYGHHYVQLARPALPAPGETKTNVEIFRLLAQRMGFTDPCFDETEDEMLDGTLNSDSPFLSGITLDRLERERFVRLNISPAGEPFLPFAQGGFRTPSGKFEFGAPPSPTRRPSNRVWVTPRSTKNFPSNSSPPKTTTA